MFSVGDKLSINIEYVKNLHRKQLVKSTLDALSYLSSDEVIVQRQGQLPEGLFFIQVTPLDNPNSMFNQGATLFFSNLEQLASCFISLKPINIIEVSLRAFNNYPKIKIPAYHVVKISYFSKTLEAPIIEFLEKTDLQNFPVAITEEVILPGLFGKITHLITEKNISEQ